MSWGPEGTQIHVVLQCGPERAFMSLPKCTEDALWFLTAGCEASSVLSCLRPFPSLHEPKRTFPKRPGTETGRSKADLGSSTCEPTCTKSTEKPAPAPGSRCCCVVWNHLLSSHRRRDGFKRPLLGIKPWCRSRVIMSCWLADGMWRNCVSLLIAELTDPLSQKPGRAAEPNRKAATTFPYSTCFFLK